MTPTEARTHLQKALDQALPHCFVQVSAQALGVLLEESAANGQITLINGMRIRFDGELNRLDFDAPDGTHAHCQPFLVPGYQLGDDDAHD